MSRGLVQETHVPPLNPVPPPANLTFHGVQQELIERFLFDQIDM
jgi:hypothetical protein